MRILLSSVACRPFGGSEGLYGWNACRAIAKDHTVWIITHEVNREQIEEARKLNMVPDSMHFIYVGAEVVCHPNRMIARLESWTSYFSFQKEVLTHAKTLLALHSFELVHQVTYTTWRIPSPLWKLPIPFIWGPISGTEKFPLSCLFLLSPASAAFEILRISMNWVAFLSPSVRACCQYSTQLVAVHQQAKEYLTPLRGKGKEIPVFSGFFFDQERMQALERRGPYSSSGKPLRIFASGNLEGRKGIAIALYALAKAKQQGIPFLYHVTSRGPELTRLQRLVQKLGLQEEVILGQSFEREEYCQSLQTFDLYLLPSLREGGGLSMMEAMLAGCVPIVADCGGPGTTVQPNCGFKISVSNPQRMAAEICEVIAMLHSNRDLLPSLGSAARERIACSYDEATFLKTINGIYNASLLVGSQA